MQVKKELDDLRDKLQPLKMKHQKEKVRLDEIRRLKQKREEIMLNLQEAERRMDLARVADLRYGALQDIEATIQRLELDTNENNMLTESVGPDQIAEVGFCFLTLGKLYFDCYPKGIITTCIHTYTPLYNYTCTEVPTHLCTSSVHVLIHSLQCMCCLYSIVKTLS